MKRFEEVRVNPASTQYPLTDDHCVKVVLTSIARTSMSPVYKGQGDVLASRYLNPRGSKVNSPVERGVVQVSVERKYF